MIKNSTIYHLLPSSFWTRRKCSSCQQFFTLQDLTASNYQLTFLSLLKINQLNLEVQVQLTHKSCCSGCINYQSDLKKTLLILTNH